MKELMKKLEGVLEIGGMKKDITFLVISGIALLLCGAVYLVNVFLPRVEPLHTILMVTALLVCIGFLISNLCYHGTRNDGKK